MLSCFSPLARLSALALLTLSFALPILATAQPAAAPLCQTIAFEEERYVVCKADPRQDEVRLFWKAGDGEAYEGFARLVVERQARGEVVRFAMNAGMYEEDLSPVGLYIEGGQKHHAANTKQGPGNFHLMPNGVFYIMGKTAGVMETKAFLQKNLPVTYATQSGPMLVIENKLHPRFDAESRSYKLRNGVGVDRQGKVYFTLSDGPVTFHAFARLFKEKLNCPNALFLDGSISSLYTPETGRVGNQFSPLGPMIGIVERKPKP